MNMKRGLGRGLDELIPQSGFGFDEVENETDGLNQSQENVSRETLIPINDIDPNRNQPRKNFNEDALNELADSIKQYNIIEPLVVQRNGKRFEIIAGERRWRAAKIAGLKEVPVIIKDYSEDQKVIIALLENIQREDLNPIEEAMAYAELIKNQNLKQDEVAEKVSKSRTAITNSMRLLKLEDHVKQMIIDEMISEGHGRALLGIEDEKLQYKTAQEVFDARLSVRETEKLVKKINSELKHIDDEKVTEEKTVHDDGAIYRELEEKLKRSLGTKVEIKKKNDSTGKIEIEYYSTEELERLIELLGRE